MGVQFVEIAGHGGEGFHARPPRAAESQAQDMPSRVGVGQQGARGLRRARLTGPDLRDAVDHVQPFGAGEQIPGLGEGLTPAHLGEPHGPPSKLLQFLYRVAHQRGGLVLEVEGVDAEGPQVLHASKYRRFSI
nr:hypothetical protein [Streptomyces bicolor]